MNLPCLNKELFDSMLTMNRYSKTLQSTNLFCWPLSRTILAYIVSWCLAGSVYWRWINNLHAKNPNKQKWAVQRNEKKKTKQNSPRRLCWNIIEGGFWLSTAYRQSFSEFLTACYILRKIQAVEWSKFPVWSSMISITDRRVVCEQREQKRRVCSRNG